MVLLFTNGSLLSAAVLLAVLNSIHGHSLGIHQLQGFDPPSSPVIPEITGAFQLDLKLRYDRSTANEFQPIFYFWDPPIFSTTITLFQSPDGTGFELTVHNSMGSTQLEMLNVIVEGEVATYSMGVTNDGTIWFQKKGSPPKSMPGTIPDNISRPAKLLGFVGPDICAPCQPLAGAILDLTIHNLDEPFHPRMYALRNIPSQIRASGFVVSFHARVDFLTGSPYIFCLADKSPHTNHVSFQVINATGAAEFSMRLADSSVASLVVDNAVTANVDSFWHLTYDPAGTLSMDRDGTTLGTTVAASAPSDVFRPTAAFGQGCAGAASGPLDGVLLGLRVDQFAVS